MKARERVTRVLNFQEADRVPLAESLFWGTTLKAWEKQGVPAGTDLDKLLNFEVHRVRTELDLRLPVRVLEETEHHVTRVSSDGVVEKSTRVNPDEAGFEHLDYLIKTPEDWAEHRHRMTPEGRVDERYVKEWQKHYDMDQFIFFYTRGPFWSACTKIDYVQFNYWLFDHPETVKDMLAAETDCIIGIWEEANQKGCKFQGAYLLDILGMKDNPYISPAQYREFVKPFHKKLCDFFRDKGYPVMLHSDGNVESLIPDLLEAGFTGLTPVEARASMDLIKLKKEYGKSLAFMGGINTDILREGDRDKIEEEVKTKTLAAKEGGGFIFHSDGSIPPDVTFENYKFAQQVAMTHGAY